MRCDKPMSLEHVPKTQSVILCKPKGYPLLVLCFNTPLVCFDELLNSLTENQRVNESILIIEELNNIFKRLVRKIVICSVRY